MKKTNVFLKTTIFATLLVALTLCLFWACNKQEIAPSTNTHQTSSALVSEVDLCNFDYDQFGRKHNELLIALRQRTDITEENVTSEAPFNALKEISGASEEPFSYEEIQGSYNEYCAVADETHSPIQLYVSKNHLSEPEASIFMDLDHVLDECCDREDFGDLIWQRVSEKEESIKERTDLNCAEKFKLLSFCSVLRHSAKYWQGVSNNDLSATGGLRGCSSCKECLKPKWKKRWIIGADAVGAALAVAAIIACGTASGGIGMPACITLLLWKVPVMAASFSASMAGFLCPCCIVPI
jgi:hypothetical protein